MKTTSLIRAGVMLGFSVVAAACSADADSGAASDSDLITQDLLSFDLAAAVDASRLVVQNRAAQAFQDFCGAAPHVVHATLDSVSVEKSPNTGGSTGSDAFPIHVSWTALVNERCLNVFPAPNPEEATRISVGALVSRSGQALISDAQVKGLTRQAFDFWSTPDRRTIATTAEVQGLSVSEKAFKLMARNACGAETTWLGLGEIGSSNGASAAWSANCKTPGKSVRVDATIAPKR